MRDPWVEKTLAGLSLEEKAGQVAMVAFFGLEPATAPDVLARIKRYHLGGYFQCMNRIDHLRDCNEVFQQEVKVPLLMAVDLESGPGYMLTGGQLFPRQMSRAAGGNARTEYELGRITALQGRAAGVNMTASPVLDVHVNPNYPDGNTRAYGDDPAVVARLGTAHVRGLQEHGMAAVAKHFPGSGSTDMDQHIAAAYVPESRARMEKVFFRPYRDAIRKANLMGVMVSHLDIPSIVKERHPVDGLPVPTSLSKSVVTGILKKKLGFRGVAMTDAFNMGGVNNRYTRAEASVKAIQAGIDILLVFDTATMEIECEGVLQGVKDGKIPLSRLDDAVRNVLSVKQRLGLDRGRGLPLPRERFREVITAGRHDTLSRAITDRAVTVLRNDGRILPLRNMSGRRAVVISAFNPDRDLAVKKGHKPYVDAVPDMLARRGLSVDAIEVVPDFADADRWRLREMIARADIVFFDLFGIPSYGIGTMLPHRAVLELFYQGLLKCGRPIVVTLFGDPFFARNVPSAGGLVLTYDETVYSQESAVKAWFGEIRATGRLPVNIPPHFKRGSGLYSSARA